MNWCLGGSRSGWLLLAALGTAACGETRANGAPGDVAASAGTGAEATGDGGTGAEAAGGSSEEVGGAHLVGGSGGDGGSGATSGQYIDEQGNCRTAFEEHVFGCEQTYSEEIARPSACGSVCAGQAGDLRLVLLYCTPSIGCAYDDTGKLVGGLHIDDVKGPCDGQSSRLVAGNFPQTPVFNDYDIDRNCEFQQEMSVSPLFNELFGKNDPMRAGAACRSGHDQCRGSIRLLVCQNESGAVAGDGTCQRCDSDAACQAEYPLMTDVRCGANGLCRSGSEAVGACSESPRACLTSSAYFACVDGICDHCTNDAQCVATGLANLCVNGECRRAAP